MNKHFLVLSAFCLIVVMVSAQNEDDTPVNQQFWFDFNTSYKVSDRVGLYGALGFRTISPHQWDRYWLRSAAKVKGKKLMLKKLYYKEELHGGLDLFYTNNIGSVNRLEITLFQAYALSWPDRERLEIKHFLKLEERFELETDNWVNTFGLRLSYEAAVIFKLQGDVWEYGKGFYIPVSAKFYWNLIGTKQFNDKVRITPGIGYHITPVWRAALLLGYNYSRNSLDDDFHTNDVIYRLRIYYKIK